MGSSGNHKKLKKTMYFVYTKLGHILIRLIEHYIMFLISRYYLIDLLDNIIDNQ